MSTLRCNVWLFCFFISAFLLLTPTPAGAQSIDPPRTAELVASADYPPDPPNDLGWSADFATWSDVLAAFTLARVQETTLLGIALPEFVLPDITVWTTMSAGERALWLINTERTARGLVPLHGLEQNVSQVAQDYAAWLLANNAFAHDADGRSPWERLDDNDAIGACHDFLGIAENLYFTATTSDIPALFVVEEAVYRMLYEDAGSAWGHRHAILWANYTENSDASDREGFVGIGHAHGGYTYDGVYYQNTDIVVMNFFDPCATWGGVEDATPTLTETPTPTASPTTTPTPTATPTVLASPSPTVSPTATQPPVPTPTPTPQAAASPTPLARQPAPPTETRSVSGQVTVLHEHAAQAGNATTEEVGLAGVTVTDQSGLTTTTDMEGWFTLAGLSPGPHTLTFSKEGYVFAPATLAIDLTTSDVAGLTIDGEPGPMGTDLSYALHLPLILPDQ